MNQRNTGMPVMDGFHLMDAIRSVSATVPIIAISSDDLGAEACEQGANAFVLKNLINAQLGPAITRLCAPGGMTRAAGADDPSQPPRPTNQRSR